MLQEGTCWPLWLLLLVWAHLFMYGRDACAAFLVFPLSRVLIMIISMLIIEIWRNGIWPRLLIQIALLCCLTMVLSVDWSGLTIFASDRGTKLRRRLEIKVGVDDDIFTPELFCQQHSIILLLDQIPCRIPFRTKTSNMPPDLLKPLSTFCTQSKSQRFIKAVRNLGDAWRTLSEPSLEDPDSAVIETTFGLNFNLKKDFGSRQDFSSKLNVPSLATASVESQQGQSSPNSTSTIGPRHFRIFPDYGTDFIWLNYNDPTYDGESSYIELEDALSGLPHEVFDNYDAWVEIYTANFKKRCDDPGDYSVHVFPTVATLLGFCLPGLLHWPRMWVALSWQLAATNIFSRRGTIQRTRWPTNFWRTKLSF